MRATSSAIDMPIITAIPMDRSIPKPAMARLPKAITTVAPLVAMLSPAHVTARSTESFLPRPSRLSSAYLLTRNMQ